MRLVEVEFAPATEPIPDQVATLLADAQQRIEQLEERSRAAIPAFVPSDFEIVYQALVAIQAARLTTGRRFLEWGSGIGVITCLALWLGFDAAGIEIEQTLVDMANDLADDHGNVAQFVCGSFVPEGAVSDVDMSGDVTWLSTNGVAAYAELELEPDDFDLIFAYPWPGEEQVIFDLFADYAAVGALLLTYHGQEGLRLQRKVRG